MKKWNEISQIICYRQRHTNTTTADIFLVFLNLQLLKLTKYEILHQTSS